MAVLIRISLKEKAKRKYKSHGNIRELRKKQTFSERFLDGGGFFSCFLLSCVSNISYAHLFFLYRHETPKEIQIYYTYIVSYRSLY